MFVPPLLRARRPAITDPMDPQVLEALAAAGDAALAEADAALTPEFAAAQRDAILARLAASTDPRVLSFPPRAEAEASTLDTPAVRQPRHAARPALGWMLTAAAAGLVVGVGTGRGIYSDLRSPAAPKASPVAISQPVVVAPIPAELDEQVLGQVEIVLAGRGVEELRPLDALTPTAVSLMASASGR